MNKPKIFMYAVLTLFLIIFISIFLFGSFWSGIVGKVTGDKDFSRPSVLFDVSVFLEYEEIEAGEKQIVTTKVINMGTEEARDVLVKYTLWDGTRENKFSEYSESIAVQTSMALVRQIYIPETLLSGDYLIDVEVEYGEQQANASSSFIVRGRKGSWLDEKNLILTILIIILLVLVVIIYFLYRLVKRSRGK